MEGGDGAEIGGEVVVICCTNNTNFYFSTHSFFRDKSFKFVVCP